ncbi:MAG: pyridoxal phosphate-dependent aminotransferase [Candidatus Thermoplasmatota archaeon]
MKSVEVTGIRKIFELAGKEAINLGLGEPDFQPAEHIKEALEKALKDGFNKYGPTAGIYQLREAVAERLRKYKKDIASEEVIITAGATEALHSAIFTFIEKGDEVLVPNPGFPLYPTEILLAGGKPVFYELKEDNNFEPEVDNFKVSKKTKGIIVNSPSNPTGGVFSKEKVKEITEFAEQHNLIIFSDEVYDEIIYDTKHFSFLGSYENVVHINSFSKTYAFTGWRLGYLAAKKEFISEIVKMHYYTVACPPTPTQYAALAALKGSQECVRKMVSEFKRRRNIAIKLINRIKNFHCSLPQGAFYLFPSYNLEIPSEKLALKILERNVICAPGNAFGSAGEKHLRFSYANSIENIEKGLEIVKEVTENL